MDLQPASQSRSNSKSTPAASMPDSTPTVQGKNMAQSAQGKFELMWQEGMNGLTTRAYIGYSRPKKKTVVLLLSWDDASDDLEVRKEVDRLKEVFETKYGYEVIDKKLSLKQQPNPQVQASHYISQLAFHHDHDDTLFIIYYAGHGLYTRQTDPGDIMLAGKLNKTLVDSPEAEQLRRKTIVWASVERIIDDTRADVLLIFDCCHAGRLCHPPTRAVPLRRYEVLAACSEDQTTPSGGERSFTSALTWAFNEFATSQAMFTTSDLRWKIHRHGPFLKGQIPQLTDRFESCPRPILLAPLKTLEAEEEDPTVSERKQMAAEFIDLRMQFDSAISDDDFADTATALRDMIQDGRIKASSIDFRGKYSHAEKAERAEKTFQSAVKAFKLLGEESKARRLAEMSQDSLIEVTGETNPTHIEEPAPSNRPSVSTALDSETTGTTPQDPDEEASSSAAKKRKTKNNYSSTTSRPVNHSPRRKKPWAARVAKTR